MNDIKVPNMSNITIESVEIYENKTVKNLTKMSRERMESVCYHHYLLIYLIRVTFLVSLDDEISKVTLLNGSCSIVCQINFINIPILSLLPIVNINHLLRFFLVVAYYIFILCLFYRKFKITRHYCHIHKKVIAERERR